MLKSIHAALSTRRLFRNWLNTAIRYLLIKHGLVSSSVTVRCGNASYRLSPDLYSFIVDAYSNGYVTGFECSNGVEFSFSDAFKLVINNDGAFIFTPEGIRLWADVIDYTVLSETWIYDIHFLGFDLSDWFVFDVGAYISGTALYYAGRVPLLLLLLSLCRDILR